MFKIILPVAVLLGAYTLDAHTPARAGSLDPACTDAVKDATSQIKEFNARANARTAQINAVYIEGDPAKLKAEYEKGVHWAKVEAPAELRKIHLEAMTRTKAACPAFVYAVFSKAFDEGIANMLHSLSKVDD